MYFLGLKTCPLTSQNRHAESCKCSAGFQIGVEVTCLIYFSAFREHRTGFCGLQSSPSVSSWLICSCALNKARLLCKEQHVIVQLTLILVYLGH